MRRAARLNFGPEGMQILQQPFALMLCIAYQPLNDEAARNPARSFRLWTLVEGRSQQPLKPPSAAPNTDHLEARREQSKQTTACLFRISVVQDFDHSVYSFDQEPPIYRRLRILSGIFIHIGRTAYLYARRRSNTSESSSLRGLIGIARPIQRACCLPWRTSIFIASSKSAPLKHASSASSSSSSHS